MEQSPSIRDIYKARETEVSLADKQRLYALAADVLWFGDTASKQIPEGGGEGIFVDNQGELSVMDDLQVHQVDEGWSDLLEAGVANVYINHWAERTSQIMKYPDQINIGIFNPDRTLEFFTIQLGLDNDLNQVRIGNRIEMRDMKLDWLELSSSDAARLDQVLNKIMDILNHRLATP